MPPVGQSVVVGGRRRFVKAFPFNAVLIVIPNLFIKMRLYLVFASPIVNKQIEFILVEGNSIMQLQ